MRIVIVGGVAGGMSAAARARRMSESAEIIVFERGDYVSFANCGLPYYVGGEIAEEDSLLLQTPESLRASLNLDVRTRHDVIAVDAEAKTVTVRNSEGTETVSYDALILSPGAKANRPDIPGIDSPRVQTLRTVNDAVTQRTVVEGGAKRAVVLGAGFIGLEAAEALALKDLDVTVVQSSSHILTPLEPEMAHLAHQELERMGITIHTGTYADAIEQGEDHDTVMLSTGERIDADLIVLSIGVHPDTEPFAEAGIETVNGAIVIDEYGKTNRESIWAVGDAVASTHAVTGAQGPVALAGPANRAGRQIADNIIRGDSSQPLPKPLGTAVVRIGEFTVAMTGANSAGLAQAGIKHHTLHLHPNNHVAYFPGGSQIHMVVHIGEDGTVLGAQAVGKSGVDKRIDVLATAIRAGMNAYDLIDLDLAYSPPYGSAKDPVNFAGMVGANVLDGTLKLWYAQDLAAEQERALILDARSAAEVARVSIPGALNIPHTELRACLDKVTEAAAGRPVRVLCQSGVRSHIANRILTEAGFDSASLSGGMLTLIAALGPEAETVLTRG